ncbi:putative pyridoxal kinase [Pichia californica]|uniref:pyridoxal kinase n=1 Tax=Pichia californica TaxID=460514 RepID=A0A9P7BDU7_9ASCO|nr:putative pyridoxal kinase [[Candida] californica]KAG0688547.1 putative pyridoxal kinase [[Candida] californica]
MENLENTIVQSKSILSIQSHVVHGYVGNKASTFPLQMLDWDVDVLNTVNFSNHTGYGDLKGVCSTGDELINIYKGLKQIDIKYDAVLTGYVHGFDTLEAVGKICLDIRNRGKRNGNQVTWLLDPVMGDEGVLYVEKNVIPIYRQILDSQQVDIATPNQYELELLLDCKIVCIESLKQALKLFHDKYKVKHIVLSSLFAELFEDLDGGPETIYCCVSSLDILDHIVFYRIDKIPGYFTGVGDMFSALLLDRLIKSQDIIISVNEVLTVMKNVLTVTKELGKTSGKIGDKNMKDCELRVIECKNFYEKHNAVYDPIYIKRTL